MIYVYGVNKTKLIKTKLPNRLSDEILVKLMHIQIKGPQLMSVNFEAILDIFKDKMGHSTVNFSALLTTVSIILQ